jgi:cell wall-associated NlpC family hydrolase
MFHRKLVYVVCAALAVLSFTARPAHASTRSSRRPLRVLAYDYAVAQQGKWYCWGGTGPSCYDCSGLVYEAYRHVHIFMARTTYGMLASGQLIPISRAHAKRGDLAFYGPGHVVMVDNPNLMYGAETTGTRIGWIRWTPYWHPTAYYRVRGAARLGN